MNTESIVLRDVNVGAAVARQIPAAEICRTREVARDNEITGAIENYFLAVVIESAPKAFGLSIARDAGDRARAAAIDARFAAVERAIVAMRRQAHVDGRSEAEA